FNVPAKEKGELLGALGPLKPQIVADASKLHPIDAAKLSAVTKLAGKVKDKTAQDLLNMAVVAGGRGHRSHAEQLVTRAGMIVGTKEVASVAAVFREGAPKRVTTPTKVMPKDTPPQPKLVGSSETDAPASKPEAGKLNGSLKLDGKAPDGFGVVMLWPEHGG